MEGSALSTVHRSCAHNYECDRVRCIFEARRRRAARVCVCVRASECPSYWNLLARKKNKKSIWIPAAAGEGQPMEADG